MSTDRAFVQLVTALAERLDELVVFGRLHPEPGRSDYALPPGARFVALPHYPRATDLAGLARALGRSRRLFAAEADGLDAVWLFGPHPVALALAGTARRHGTPVVLGIRQSFPDYVASRLPRRVQPVALPAAWTLEWTFRLLARRFPAVVVGDDLGRKYAGGRAPVLATGFSLIRREDVVAAEAAHGKDWDGPLRLLSVGRLDPEKNPLLLPEILAGLGDRWQLDVVGIGSLEADLRRKAAELGVADRLRLHGYVRNGPALWELYRSAHALLHVSFTEGLPQVLYEAEAAGLPIVATAVGGVADALGNGERGLLVGPDDAAAAVAAVRRLEHEPDLRRRLVDAVLVHASASTLDAQLDAIEAFLRASRRRRGAAARP